MENKGPKLTLLLRKRQKNLITKIGKYGVLQSSILLWALLIQNFTEKIYKPKLYENNQQVKNTS